MKKRTLNNTYLITFSSILSIAIIINGLYYLLFEPILYLNENQLLYIFSTIAQVIAGLFGLSMAGFVFLNESLDKSAVEDPSLEEILEYLRKDYFHNIIFMSAIGAISIILSLLCISLIGSISFVYNMLLNTTILVATIEVILIISFVCMIVEPKKISRISLRLKKNTETTTSSEKGNLKQFLIDFNEIEKLLQEKSPQLEFEHYIETVNSKRYLKNRISNSRLIENLYRYEIIGDELRSKLLKIVSYRNYVIHSSEVDVEKYMCELTSMAKKELSNIA